MTPKRERVNSENQEMQFINPTTEIYRKIKGQISSCQRSEVSYQTEGRSSTIRFEDR